MLKHYCSQPGTLQPGTLLISPNLAVQAAEEKAEGEKRRLADERTRKADARNRASARREAIAAESAARKLELASKRGLASPLGSTPRPSSGRPAARRSTSGGGGGGGVVNQAFVDRQTELIAEKRRKIEEKREAHIKSQLLSPRNRGVLPDNMTP